MDGRRVERVREGESEYTSKSFGIKGVPARKTVMQLPPILFWLVLVRSVCAAPYAMVVPVTLLASRGLREMVDMSFSMPV